MSTQELEIIVPDDFHHHFRDGDVLADVVGHAAKSFSRVLAMPNIKPPVRTLEEAQAYKQRILSHVSSGNSLELLMTLYLTDNTTPEDIIRSKESGIVFAAKLYPAGATTNSEFGVTDINKIGPVLQAMSDVGMPMLVHGEVVDSNVDIFDREQVFVDTILRPLITAFPKLKVVMEHITTDYAANFVGVECADNPHIAATITAHHLLYNSNAIFKGGVCPHMYCLPILKREKHRVALVQAATSGSGKFFIGTDSAPHAVEAKESACGCAGIFTGHAPLELYTEAFESVGALDKLEGFTSIHGAQFYDIPVNTKKIALVKESWVVPERYTFGSSVIRPLRAGEEIAWKVKGN
jgi:dihydroorotase